MWGTAADANENQSHYRPQMRMILIYALAKRDHIGASGRLNFASPRFSMVKYTHIKREAHAMTTIISLYLCAFLFLVAFGALAVAFTNWISKEIPCAPCDERDLLSDENA